MDRVTLRDGSRILIRPIEPDDRDAVAAGFERLSPESRYRRFFGPMPVLRKRDLDYLTVVDHHDHEALVAVDEATGQGTGVARFVRTAEDEAEPAIVVVDDWHGRGVASHLLDALVERAREEGVTWFNTPILATNADAIRVFERLGETTRRQDGREVVLRIRLPEAPDPSPPGLRDLLRAAATGTVAPARTLLDLLIPRRRGAPDDPRRDLILVGTDGSAAAGRAIEVAASLAGPGTSVHVLGVLPFLAADGDALRAAVADAARRLRERGVHVHELLRQGDPALVLADVAEEERARLIVVGAGDRSQARRRVLGSIAGAVARRAPCDVLIVRD